MDKNSIRKMISIKRDRMPAELRLRYSAKIAGLFNRELLPSLGTVKCAMAYISTRSEVRTSRIINSLMAKNISIYVPCLDCGTMKASKLVKGAEMSPGAFRIMEPKKKRFLRKCSRLDLIIVPGIAFDRNGNRIGFGKGYFDKFMAKVPKTTVKVALAFSAQMVKAIPSQIHDVGVDYIVTEKGIIKTIRD
ncbi:MAG: 5-formyltetrahydrofolate cyclo-ligase [Spirochaetia bacterium]|nr:5-formyltetrahydrofolate cyclo-ligase [Spirochaetia bacterium]